MGHPILLLLVVTSAPLFWLLAYNSGYGYDQLEYLVIGRALAEGIPFYTYVPSKSFGIFAVVAALYRAGVRFGHVSLSVVITVVYVTIVVATYLVVWRVVAPFRARGLSSRP